MLDGVVGGTNPSPLPLSCKLLASELVLSSPRKRETLSLPSSFRSEPVMSSLVIIGRKSWTKSDE